MVTRIAAGWGVSYELAAFFRAALQHTNHPKAERYDYAFTDSLDCAGIALICA